MFLLFPPSIFDTLLSLLSFVLTALSYNNNLTFSYFFLPFPYSFFLPFLLRKLLSCYSSKLSSNNRIKIQAIFLPFTLFCLFPLSFLVHYWRLHFRLLYYKMQAPYLFLVFLLHLPCIFSSHFTYVFFSFSFYFSLCLLSFLTRFLKHFLWQVTASLKHRNRGLVSSNNCIFLSSFYILFYPASSLFTFFFLNAFLV